MIALLLVFGLFIFLTLLGQAVISLIKPRLGVLWSWFVSPTLGLAIVVLITTRINVWGVPLKDFGLWLTLALAIFTAAVLFWRRPVFPWRQLLPFLAITVVYLAYTGWPLLRFGFDWISYGNDDMANYCLAADRFLNHGYYEIPLQTDLEGRDYGQHYWFMHALQQIRPGSELTVAWVASITGLKAHQTFMPAILMLSMLQLFALGAVTIVRGRYRKLALLAMALFATSPLFGLGTLYQLIAQVGGIALLLAVSSLTLTTKVLTWRKTLVTGLLTGLLGIFYPEVAPFVALSIAIFAIRLRYTDMAVFKRYAYFILGTAALTFLFIGTNTYQFINTLVMQSVGSAGLGAMTEINDQSGGLVLFPWTLVPSFIPMLFGLHPFGVVGVDPLISIKIALGLGLLVFLVVRAVRNTAANMPIGYLGVVMLLLGFYLFSKGQDFGLFKLAMFIQPVVTLTVAQLFLWLIVRAPTGLRRAGKPLLAVFIALTVPAHTYYSYASLGTYGGGLTEVVGASEFGVKFTPPTDLAFDGIESDISNVVTAKMLAQYTKGFDTRFLSRSYMDNIANIAVLKFLRDPDPDLGPQARLIEKLSLLRFLLPAELMEGDVPDYQVMTINKLDNNWTQTSSRHFDYRDRLFVAVRRELDHFNKLSSDEGWTVDHMYQYKLKSDISNRLVFVHSELSPHYYSAARFKAAFFQREPEPITAGVVYFHGTGRYNVFNIVNPTGQLRMVIDFSRTSLGDFRSKLPVNARIIGEGDYPLPFVGHGSARIVSPPLTPEFFEQAAYLTLDFGDRPSPILKEKTGLMRLYGEIFNLDDRRLVGFTRDISLITEEQYLAMERPTRIGDFPWDLAKYPGFEYSGMFEDGWMAEEAYFKMGPSTPGQVLNFKGFVPATPRFKTEGVNVTISINDKPTEIVNVKAGEFTLTRLIREPAAITTIRLQFSAAEMYGDDDKREVSAFVREISIDNQADFAALRRLGNEAGENVTLAGIDDDGWLGNEAVITTPAFDGFKVLKLDLENPGAAPSPTNRLTVQLDDEPATELTLTRADYGSLVLPLTANTPHTVRLGGAEVFPLPGEARERAYLLKNITFENVSPTDLFTRGWHPNGFRFGIDRADADGWVDRRVAFRFPPTTEHTAAVIQVLRYPSLSDLPLTVTLDGVASPRSLALETIENVRVSLAADRDATLTLEAPRNYPLSAADPRERSFRIVSINFE